MLDAAVRLVDLGCFRLGSESYLEEHGSYGLTTLERGAMRQRGDTRVFTFVAKAGVEQEIGIDDPPVVRVLDALARGRRPSSRLLSYRDCRRWHVVTSAEVNERAAVGDAEEPLGNTPAFARRSYVDPRVLDLFEAGEVADRARTADGRDRAVVALLRNRAG